MKKSEFKRMICLCLVISITLLSCSRKASNKDNGSYKDVCNEKNDSSYITMEQDKDGLSMQDSSKIEITTFGVNLDTTCKLGNKDNTEAVPNVPSLYFAKRWSYCKVDSCNTGYYVIGLRCPSKLLIKKWCSDTIWKVMKKNGYKNIKKLPVYNYLVSDKQIYNYYLDNWKGDYDHYLNQKLVCEHLGKFKSPTEQYGLFVLDVWKHKGLYTMCVYDWYDMSSCGNTGETSFYTISSYSGNVLTTKDIIHNKDKAKLETLLKRKLAWEIYQRGRNDKQDISFIDNIDGIALIKEGLLVYFHSYNIGCGAEGQYNIVLPYRQLKENNIILKVL